MLTPSRGLWKQAGGKLATSPFSTGGLRTERRTARRASEGPVRMKGRHPAQILTTEVRGEPISLSCPSRFAQVADSPSRRGLKPRPWAPCAQLGPARQGKEVARSRGCSTQSPTCCWAQPNKHALDQARRLPGTAGLPRACSHVAQPAARGRRSPRAPL